MANSWSPFILSAVSNSSLPPVEMSFRWVLRRFGEAPESEVVEDESHFGIICTVKTTRQVQITYCQELIDWLTIKNKLRGIDAT